MHTHSKTIDHPEIWVNYRNRRENKKKNNNCMVRLNEFSIFFTTIVNNSYFINRSRGEATSHHNHHLCFVEVKPFIKTRNSTF